VPAWTQVHCGKLKSRFARSRTIRGRECSFGISPPSSECADVSPRRGRAGGALDRRQGQLRCGGSKRAASFWAAPWAHQLAAGFVPIPQERQASPCHGSSCLLARVRPGRDGDARGCRVAGASASSWVDDLIATGGTAEAAVKLLRKLARRSWPPASSSTCRNWRSGETGGPWACRQNLSSPSMVSSFFRHNERAHPRRPAWGANPTSFGDLRCSSKSSPSLV